LGQFIANTYYFFKNVRKVNCGSDNLILVNTQDEFAFLSNTLFDIRGNNNIVIVSCGVYIADIKILVSGDNNKIVFGEKVQMSGGCLWINGSECQIVIGKHTTINEAIIGVSEKQSSVIIGEDCMLAHGIDIRSGDSHSIIDLISNQRINHARDITIDNHIWIAANCHILKGVCIGKNSVIGAGSIVTKDIPENSIAVDVPEIVRRENITWLREDVSQS